MFDEQTRVVAGIAGIGRIDANPPSLTERLKAEQKQLEQRYDEVTAVLNSLEANPDTQAILDAVARLGHLNY